MGQQRQNNNLVILLQITSPLILISHKNGWFMHITKMEEKIFSEIRKLVPENITQLLPAEELDPAVLFLLQHTQDTMTKDGR